MYILEKYESGYVTVSSTTRKYRVRLGCSSSEDASSLVAEMNRPFFKDTLTEYRYSVEVSGLLYNSIPLHTDRDSQAVLFFYAQQNLPKTWKGSDGEFYELTAEEVKEASSVVLKHREDCFRAEALVVNTLNSISDHEELDKFDVKKAFDGALASLVGD